MPGDTYRPALLRLGVCQVTQRELGTTEHWWGASGNLQQCREIGIPALISFYHWGTRSPQLCSLIPGQAVGSRGPATQQRRSARAEGSHVLSAGNRVDIFQEVTKGQCTLACRGLLLTQPFRSGTHLFAEVPSQQQTLCLGFLPTRCSKVWYPKKGTATKDPTEGTFNPSEQNHFSIPHPLYQPAPLPAAPQPRALTVYPRWPFSPGSPGSPDGPCTQTQSESANAGHAPPESCCRIHRAERCWSLTDTVTGRTKNNAQKQPWDSHPRMDPHPSALRLRRGSLTPRHPARVHGSDTHGRLGCTQ